MGEDKPILDLLKSTPNILGQVYADVAQPSVKARPLKKVLIF